MARPKTTDPTDHQMDIPPPVPAHELIVPSRYTNSALIPAKGTALADCPCNFDQGTREGRMMAFNAISISDVEMGNNEEAEFVVRYWLVHWRETVNEETGEMKEYPALTLISPDNKVFTLTSDVVLHRWRALIEQEGNGPWDPPIVVMIRCQKSRKTKRTWHELRRLS